MELYPFIHLTLGFIFLVPLQEKKQRQDFCQSGKDEVFSEFPIDTTCYFFHSFPLWISRGLTNSTNGMDEFVASSKCVKDHSRT